MQNLNELKKITYDIGQRRMKNGADLSNGDFLRHLGKELVQAAEKKAEYETYLTMNGFSSFGDDCELLNYKEAYAKELCDIIICALNEAEKYDIDIEYALDMTIRKNEARANLQCDKI